MGGDHRFWIMFSGIFLLVGIGFLATAAGIHLFVDAGAINQGMPTWAAVAIGLAIAGFGGVILYFTLTRAARDRRLMQFGISLTATVVDLERSRIDINRQTRWHVRYRYDHGGRSLEGRSGTLQGEEVMGFKPGDKVSIKVDPQKPEESLFLGAA